MCATFYGLWVNVPPYRNLLAWWWPELARGYYKHADRPVVAGSRGAQHMFVQQQATSASLSIFAVRAMASTRCRAKELRSVTDLARSGWAL